MKWSHGKIRVLLDEEGVGELLGFGKKHLALSLVPKVLFPGLGVLWRLFTSDDLIKALCEPAFTLGRPTADIQAGSIPGVDLGPPRSVYGLVAFSCGGR